VIILNKDAGVDIEVELDFGRDRSGAVETETLRGNAHHRFNEGRFAQAGQGLGQCSPSHGITTDTDLSRCPAAVQLRSGLKSK
jgi:hypothetical protein